MTWSECSWVTRMPAQSLMFRPSSLSAAEVVRTPFPISMMMYFSPVRTTLQLPEEPEYNEMNSDILNLKKRTSPSLLHKSSLSGKLLQNRLRGSE